MKSWAQLLSRLKDVWARRKPKGSRSFKVKIVEKIQGVERP